MFSAHGAWKTQVYGKDIPLHMDDKQRKRAANTKKTNRQNERRVSAPKGNAYNSFEKKREHERPQPQKAERKQVEGTEVEGSIHGE